MLADTCFSFRFYYNWKANQQLPDKLIKNQCHWQSSSYVYLKYNVLMFDSLSLVVFSIKMKDS